MIDAQDTLLPEDYKELSILLGKEWPKFDAVVGKTTLIEHRIRLKENVLPTKQQYYLHNPVMKAITDQEVYAMFRETVVESHTCPSSTSVV